MKRNKVIEDLGCLDQFFGDAEHQTLDNLISWLKGLREIAPAEHRAGIIVWKDFEYGSDGDNDITYYRFYYERDETEEDVRKREAEAAERRAREQSAQQAREMAQLNALIRKYGVPK